VVDSVLDLADVTRRSRDRATGLQPAGGSAYELSQSVRVTKNTGISTLGSDAPATGTTGNLQRDALNVRAIYRLARAVALARAADTYSDAPFDSSKLAAEVANALRDEIDALQAYSAGDDLIDALSDVRASASRHLAEAAVSLPRTITHSLKDEIPALLIAHSLYGDARLEADVVARNRMEHPLLVSGDIEVLAP